MRIAPLLLSVAVLGGCANKPCLDPVETSSNTTSPGAASSVPTRTPVVRLHAHNGWSSGHALEIPAFTLYDDGLVLFVRGEGDTAQAMQARLSTDATYMLLDRVNATLADLPARSGQVGHDMPSATIGVTHQGRIYSVQVDDPSNADHTLQGFVDLYRELEQWDHDDAQPWTPDELMIVLFRTDTPATHAWPTGIPTPPSDVREPRPRPLGRNGKTIRQPVRYRITGDHEPRLAELIPPMTTNLAPAGSEVSYDRVYAWNDVSWQVRYERVVPARTWFW